MTDDNIPSNAPASTTPSTPPEGRSLRRSKARFFGQFLLAEGFITAPQLLAALEYQEQFNARLGEYAVASGLLTLFDAQKIHALQVSKDLLFGQAALELGLLDKEQLRQAMAAQRNDHVLLGEALCKLGYITEDALARALAELNNSPDQIDRARLPTFPTELGALDVVEKAVYLTNKLLPRLWDLQNKPADAQVCTPTLLLSDRNAMISVQGDCAFRIYLGVPHAIAERAVRIVSGRGSATDAECDEAVGDLLSTICNNLEVTLAAEGTTISASAAEIVDFKVELDHGTAVLVPFVTHQGQVILAFAY